MLFIENVLNQEELATIISHLEKAEFVDGKVTAGWYAKEVKNNQQVSAEESFLKQIRSIVLQALQRNSLFQAAVRPRKIRPILFSRYEPGMSYGMHTDNALMGKEEKTRSDVSLTLFLNTASSYTGGELVVDTDWGEKSVKLDAGSMVVYPSSQLHRVETVTSGVRLAAVTWVQSWVRSLEEREILFELETVRQSMYEKYGRTQEFDILSKTHANLLRKWVES
jgi:PKHD-type hydroxylase